jgi:hypothetical protein
MVIERATKEVTNWRRIFMSNNYRDVMSIYADAKKKQEQRLAEPDPAAGMTVKEMDEIIKVILGPDTKK